MASIGTVVRRRRDEIVQAWLTAARRTTFGRELDDTERIEGIAGFLDLLGRAPPRTAELTEAQTRWIERHMASRLRAGFELNELQTELKILGQCIHHAVDAEPPELRPSHEEQAALAALLLRTSDAITRIFHEHLLEDSQPERRFARTIQSLADDLDRPLHDRLCDALHLVMDAIAGDAAATHLISRRTGEVIAELWAGDGGDVLLRTTAGLDASALTTAATLAVDEPLRAAGFRALLGFGLGRSAAIAGGLFVALRQPEAISASQLRRLEALAETLALHIENAWLRERVLSGHDARWGSAGTPAQ